MAALNSLKQALRAEVPPANASPRLPLSDIQYSTAFEIFKRGEGAKSYQDFIIPQLSQLLAPLFASRTHISILEVGPGPESVLGSLPERLRRKIKNYVAFEPNSLFATRLEQWFCHASPLPRLKGPPEVRRSPFVLESDTEIKKYDVVLFCHSMYGMKPKRKFIERALGMLDEQAQGSLVAVFHRDGILNFDGLVCHQTSSFPTGEVRVADNEVELDCFASFVVGFTIQDAGVDEAVRARWRQVCRTMGHHEEGDVSHLLFRCPEIMVAFTRHATALQKLADQVPQINGDMKIKNREAQSHHPAAVFKPTEVRHVQECVRWALEHGVGLTVIGGGHSGQCMWSGVAAIDMSSFNKLHTLVVEQSDGVGSEQGPLVFAESGCKTGDVIRETLKSGLTVPLGARPSVGAGLWLQGGIGHLSRLHGLACDGIVGAVVVSLKSGQVLCIGHVPSAYWPAGAVRPEGEHDLLWAVKGAGTNFGIVLGVTFRAFAAPTYLTQNWVVPLKNELEARAKLGDFNQLLASQLPSNCSADVYLYGEAGQLHLSVTMFEVSLTGTSPATEYTRLEALWGPGSGAKALNGVDLFDADMYVSGMHGGHAGGKTSSFKRCIFLQGIGRANIVDRLTSAVQNRPSPFCYLHLLHGGGSKYEVTAGATAFGCRDWDFACVITGVWLRDQDGTELALSAVRWVYKVAESLLPVSSGAYGADLGPDPRDAALAAKAFGENRTRLGRLKHELDPGNVLAYACPLPKPKSLMIPKIIILVTGESCSGKDYCAAVWTLMFSKHCHQSLTARTVSISDSTKKEYAAATGADLGRLLNDRPYKELHRLALTEFFQDQVRQRPELPKDHFLGVVYDAEDADILLVTGMREKAPVATMSHLVPGSRVLEVNVQVSDRTRQIRQGCSGGGGGGGGHANSSGPSSTVLEYHPDLTFINEAAGNEEIERFAERHLLPLCHEDLHRLAGMVRSVPNFPSPGVDFRHILGIAQQPGGLALCASLLRSRFTGDWSKVDAVASCEAGGFIYASVLASQVNVPLALLREAGKLPPPTVSVAKSASYVASCGPDRAKQKRMEMERDALPRGGASSVVVVDDVLSTGETLCAVLELLKKAGVCAERVSVMVVAEFPVHRGRELLYKRGFGRANVQSLLVFGGV